MKKFLLATSMLSMAMLAHAQVVDYQGVTVVVDTYGQKVSPDGKVIVGQNPIGDVFTYNIATSTVYDYGDGIAGSGNCVSATGVTVGQTYVASNSSFLATTMKNGETTVVQSLSKYTWGLLSGITADGTRACGIVNNPNQMGDVTDPGFNSMMYVPFYVDLQSDGTFGQPHFLPVAPRDFFGAVPQLCSAVWISDDGMTIAGQVVSNDGKYRYPIVYKEDASGNWTYSLPSESLFNTKNVEVPTYPEFNLEPPSPTDYMTNPEDINDFEEAVDFWFSDGFSDESNPYIHLENWLDADQIAAYEKAVEDYTKAAARYEDVTMPRYLAELDELLSCSIFFAQNAMALSSDGKYLASSHNIPVVYNGFLPVENFQPYVFDLSNGTYKVYGTEQDRLITNQIFPDGTLVCATPVPGEFSPDMTPQHSYVVLPGSDRVMTIEEYVAIDRPEYARWMESNLYKHLPVDLAENGGYVFKDLTVSGCVSFSADRSVMAAGVDGYNLTELTIFPAPLDTYFTYIFEGMPTTGVQRVETGQNDNAYIYNLQGVKVGEMKEGLLPDNLPKGVYVANGKKIRI